MSVSCDDGAIRLTGPCPVEDAEPLLALLLADRGRGVDLTAAGHLHAAVVQLLLAFRPQVIGPAGDAFIMSWVEPLLAGRGDHNASFTETGHSRR